MAKLTKDQFVFHKNEPVGNPSAEQDEEYLKECFVDSGDLRRLGDKGNPRTIILGRTGAGKSALLLQLAATESQKSIWIDPEQLSFQYLINSDTIARLEKLGVNLSLFYKLLWMHVFFIEVVKKRFHIKNEEDKRTLISRLKSIFSSGKESPNKQRAMQYIDEWGGTFWNETEYRIKEFTQKIEEKIKSSASVKASGGVLAAGLDEASDDSASTELKGEVVRHAQEVIQSIQIKDLYELMWAVREEFCSEPHHQYYILIDRLDENWIDDSIRYKLIRSLIDVSRELPHKMNVKLVLALRNDLYRRVIDNTRDTGFQEEKYDQHLLKLTWKDDELIKVLDMRIKRLIRRQYTSSIVSHSDVLPAAVSHDSVESYIIKRTMRRPRDIIAFFNFCITKADGQPEISSARIKEAEADYSRERVKSLCDEWRADYPELRAVLDLIKMRKSQFFVADITELQLSEFCLDLGTQTQIASGEITRRAQAVLEQAGATILGFRRFLVHVLFRVGVFGLKIETYDSVAWSFLWHECDEEKIEDSTPIHVCPMVHRSLGIAPVGK